MKVAIVQNRVGVDGRSKVLAEIIKVLNDLGLKPRLITLSSDDEFQLFQEEYFKKPPILEHIGVLRWPFPRAHAYQVLLSNALSKRYLQGCHLLINANSSPYFNDRTMRILYYIHFPWEAEWSYSARYSSPTYRLYLLPLRIVRQLIPPAVKGQIVVANSNFTCEVTAAVYRLPQERIERIYPPAYERPEPLTVDFTEQESVDVITVGAFTPDKMQLEQLQIAADCPELKFAIAGRVPSHAYFERCRHFVREYGCHNVRLFPNISRAQLMRLLLGAKIFLHSRRYEHFGIATVEAIAAGCLPIVHDSGGQREVVPIDELRYSTKEDAVAKVREVWRLSDSERRRIVRKLNEHAESNFSVDVFRSKFRQIIVRYLQ